MRASTLKWIDRDVFLLALDNAAHVIDQRYRQADLAK
jgi:hypothetical protein